MSAQEEPQDRMPSSETPGVPQPPRSPLWLSAAVVFWSMSCVVLVAVAASAFTYARWNHLYDAAVGVNVLAYAEFFGLIAFFYLSFALLAGCAHKYLSSPAITGAPAVAFLALFPVGVIGLAHPQALGFAGRWGEVFANWVL